MTVQDTQELFNEGGSLPVWGHNSASGKPYYTFKSNLGFLLSSLAPAI